MLSLLGGSDTHLAWPLGAAALIGDGLRPLAAARRLRAWQARQRRAVVVCESRRRPFGRGASTFGTTVPR